MIQNISKYVQLNDFLLLEYEFSRDGTTIDMTDMGAIVAITDSSVKQFFNVDKTYALGSTNNILELQSVATNTSRSNWFNDYTNTPVIDSYEQYFDTSILIDTTEYEYDTVKVHVVSGYNFDDVAGFLLQVRAKDTGDNKVDLSNFTYIKQTETRGSDVVKFASNILYLGNRFYDKYITFKVPSVYALGAEVKTDPYDTSLGQILAVANLSDVYLTYSTISNISTASGVNTFLLSDSTNINLPVTSNADNFNCFIAESTIGDFIEFYATWKDVIIGEYMSDIESGRISLFTSNNPNDNYQEFTETYGVETAKWVVIHEVYVYEQLPGVTVGSSLLTQKFVFTQEGNFTLPNYFRPVLKNADIDSSFTIQYICRLSNRMDGTQIIRRASFASTNPKKYGLKFPRLNVENLIPYKVFNKIDNATGPVIQGNNVVRTKYSKVFFDVTNILYNQNNEVYPNAMGPLFLKSGDSMYKFKFERYNEATDQQENVDLSGVFNYALFFRLDDKTTMEIVPTYSTNMNTNIGELEFKISEDQSNKLLNQQNNKYSIIVKNPDGTYYTFYEGDYYSSSDQEAILSRYNFLLSGGTESENLELKSALEELQQKYNRLLSETRKRVTPRDDRRVRDSNDRIIRTNSPRLPGSRSDRSSVRPLNRELREDGTVVIKRTVVPTLNSGTSKPTSSSPTRTVDVRKPISPADNDVLRYTRDDGLNEYN